MFGRLMPTEGKFFDLFNQHAALCVKGAQEMVGLMTNFDDLENRTHAVESVEKQADKITYATVELLHKTFITPIDREQILSLINAMDDVLDLLQDTAETMALYDVHAVTEELRSLAELSVKCCERVQHAVSLLPKLNVPAVAEAAIKTCEEIDKLESDADRVMRSAMSKLFRQEPDVRELIKLKAIYEQLESISDRCEDVANLIEGVVLENS